MSTKSQSEQHSHARWPHKVQALLRAAVRAALAGGALMAVLPTLLSTRWGIRAVEAAATCMTPGTVQVASVQCGWLQPWSLKGLVIYEGAPGEN